MSKPRTPAQQMGDYRKTFPTGINDRRCELIRKMFDHGDDSLTELERAEYAEATRIVDGWQANSPYWKATMALLAEREAKIEAIMARHGIPPRPPEPAR